MNSDADAIAALISAVEQRLLVAVVRRDQAAVLTARAAIARLKEQFPPQPQHHAFASPVHPAPTEACARHHRH